MAATILNTPRAVEMSVYVVRAFVKLRELLSSHAELARKLEALERSVASLDADTRQQFEEVYGAILSLMGPGTGKQYQAACRAYVARATARPCFTKAHADQMAHFAATG